MPTPAFPRIVSCPGLKITTNAGVSFTDCLKRVYDLEKEKTLRPKEAASDARMGGVSPTEILKLIRNRQLYPVLWRNRRVVLIFECALVDWRARAFAQAGKTSPHLFEQRNRRSA